MDSSGNSINQAIRTLKEDPKKGGALAILLVILLVLGGRLVLSGGKKISPAAAKASLVSKQRSQALSLKSSGPVGTSGQRQQGMTGSLQKWLETPVPPVSRNLFAVRIDYFPVDGSRTAQLGATDGGFWAKLEKSMAIQADQRDKRENLIANFTAQASKLRLQSTMPGAQPRAMVNGELVGEGSVVADFRVLKIEARRIIVEREGIRLEIQMK